MGSDKRSTRRGLDKWGFLPGLGLCLLALVFGLGAKNGPAAPGVPPPTIGVDEIRPGMKGYGLTVFAGTVAERFEVEVISVVKNALPQQDMILVRCAGHELEKTHIIAGMSGSPVFLDGRMAGAVAYGWSFALDPIAGVTPIADMIRISRDQQLVSSAAGSVPALSASTSRLADPAPVPTAKAAFTSFNPIATPLLVSGFGPASMELLTAEFAPYNLVPMAGGGGGSTALDRAAAASVAPGDAVGAALITGDFVITAIGTLSWRDGDRVVAFGHPFLEAGSLSMPLISANIHTVIATQSVSFKLGSPVATIGRLVADRQAGIVGELGQEAATIPCRVLVHRPATGYDHTFNLQLASFPALAPALVRAALVEVVTSAAPSLDPATVRLKSKYWLAGYGAIEYTDVYAILRGSFSNAFLDPLVFFLRNPFEEIKLERAEFELTVDDELKAALIESVWLSTDEAAPGSTVELGVVLRPYNRPPAEYRFQIKVPKDPKVRQLQFQVSGGNECEPDIATPDSVPDMIKFLATLYPADSLLLSFHLPDQGVDLKGQRLHTLPPSINSILQPPNANLTSAAGDVVTQVQPTPYVIIGEQRITLKIKENVE